ncbi:hypothetical protein Avbf_00689 [Armadillidium vulgare]|nr:hypothetical protein Avbf_00689 [Armadillidium vulgare]
MINNPTVESTLESISQNEENESYEKVEKKSEEKPLLLIEKNKLRDKGGTKSVESDFSSFGDDGTEKSHNI